MPPRTRALRVLLVVVVCVLTRQTNGSAPSVTPAALRGGSDAPAQARIHEAYGRLPLSFEANRGQAPAEVDFVSRGSGYTLFVTATEAVLALRAPTTPEATTKDGERTQGHMVRMQLVGANATAQPEGRNELPGKVNYFIGNDPKQWRSGVSTYAQVRYQAVYPGIDLVYYGNQRELEYDFIVAPGADPDSIALTFDGADALEVNEAGNLVLHAGAGRLLQRAPHVYQEIDGARKDIPGRYALQDATADRRHVRFELGDYDRRRPLVIDPVLAYSTYLGGKNLEDAFGIAVDSAGSAYVIGDTYSSDFPTTPEAYGTTLGGSQDAFVTKLNASGSAIVYSTFLGGSGSDTGVGIAVDSSGSAYVTGITASTDFPTAPGSFDVTYGGGIYDAFVTKLDANGSALMYSTYLGGSDYDTGYGIAVDSAGSAYVTGGAYSTDFPTTLGAFDTTFGGSGDAFVTKLNANGSALTYSTYLGGSGYDTGYAIAFDSAGSAYVTGQTASSDLSTTPGAFDRTFGGVHDAFVTKLAASGAGLVYSTYLGGSQWDEGRGIAVDGAGSAYVTGPTASSDGPTTPGAFDVTYGGGSYDAFVTKLAASGAALVYSTYLGGSGFDRGQGIAVDSAGRAYVAGTTYSSDFPTTPEAFGTTLGGVCDAFVTKLEASGALPAYSIYLGGKTVDFGHAISIDGVGNVYVAGGTESKKFPTTPDAFDITRGGALDAFVAKIALEADIDLVPTALSNPPAVVVLAETFSVTDTVENQGGTPAGKSRTRHYLSIDTLKTSGDKVLVGDRLVPALGAGGTSTGAAEVTLAANTKLGVYFLLACADDADAVGETDEANNCRASATSLEVRAPDLAETAVSNPPATRSPGDSFSVTDTVGNQGNAASGPSTTRYYLSLNTTKNGSDPLLTGTRGAPALGVGSQSTDTVTVTIPVTVTPGTYYLLACGDDLNAVKESDDKNNCKASAARVSIGP